jgi:hypothetical protein
MYIAVGYAVKRLQIANLHVKFERIKEIAKEERNGDVVIEHGNMRAAHRVLIAPPLSKRSEGR